MESSRVEKNPHKELTTRLINLYIAAKSDVDRSAQRQAAEFKNDDIVSSIIRFNHELLCLMHYRVFELVAISYREIELTAIEKYFIRVYCSLKTIKDALSAELLDKLQHIVVHAKEKEARADKADEQEILRLMGKYFSTQSSAVILPPEHQDDSLDPTLFQLATRLRKRGELSHPGFAQTDKLALKQFEDFSLKTKATAIEKQQIAACNQQVKRHLVNLLMTAICYNLKKWGEQLSFFGSYSEIDRQQVPGSLVPIFDNLKRLLHAQDNAEFSQHLSALVQVAKMRVGIQSIFRYSLFGLRDTKVIDFLNILAQLNPNKIDIDSVQQVEDDLVKMNLRVNRAIPSEDLKGLLELSTTRFTNGCFIRI